MTYLPLDHNYLISPTVRRLSAPAKVLDIAALLFASSRLTDGRIDNEQVRVLLSEAKVRSTYVDELVRSGRWIVVEGGFLLRNYLNFNRSRQQIEDGKAANRAKQKRYRSKEGDEYTEGATVSVTRHTQPALNTPDGSEAVSRDEGVTGPSHVISDQHRSESPKQSGSRASSDDALPPDPVPMDEHSRFMIESRRQSVGVHGRATTPRTRRNLGRL